LDSHESDIIE
jgi:hypothetical protein